MQPQLLIAPASELVELVTQNLQRAAQTAIDERGRFSLALSGGSTPKKLYENLASPKWKSQFDWPKIDLFFGDDRAVSPDDALSNFRMAREALFDFVDARVHRLQTESADLEGAARNYELLIRALGAPLDVVLLGLGSDGHTASLFPHSPQLGETEKWVVATPVASLEPHVRRITFTFSAINAAREAWFLVAGDDKAERVHEVLNGPRDVQRLPAQGVAPQSGELKWFLDEAAARLVK